MNLPHKLLTEIQEMENKKLNMKSIDNKYS